MFDELNKYKSNNHFFLTKKNDLQNVCNAPEDGIGVYVVYALKGGRIELVYIGSSGKLTQERKGLVHQGGLGDRIVNVKPFGEPRKKSFKSLVIAENIEALDIYWYETFDKENRDLPNTIKGILLQRFYEVHGRLPRWNKEF